jgi:hypothetical protein
LRCRKSDSLSSSLGKDNGWSTLKAARQGEFVIIQPFCPVWPFNFARPIHTMEGNWLYLVYRCKCYPETLSQTHQNYFLPNVLAPYSPVKLTPKTNHHRASLSKAYLMLWYTRNQWSQSFYYVKTLTRWVKYFLGGK